jgi:hypothetical protein
MGGVIDNAERHANHLGHALAGPELSAEAIGVGAALQHCGQLGELLNRQPARGSRGWGMA